MRRLRSAGAANERGAVSVLVALLMVVLLGFAALAIDVGMLVSEKAQLQNGADAAALGIAQRCAKDLNDATNCASSSVEAQDLANSNALDAKTRIVSTNLQKTAGRVTVTTGAREAGTGANHVSLVFANVLGVASTDVTASASAAWGGPSKVEAPFAIAFSKCEIDSTRTADGALQFLRSHGLNDTGDNCHGTSSGHEIPGGFGWLVQDISGSCQATVSLSSPWVASDSGDNLKDGCGPRLNEWKAKLAAGERLVQLFPVFDDTAGTGSGGKFRIVAFAAIDVRGWNFQGYEYMLADARSHFTTNGYNNSDRGFIGRFVRYVSLDEAVELGGPMIYGANVVQLTQ
ncbi:pilus assembly protein TadG-related protein [Arthrobacter sp. Ld5]|uniref:pilus assembly protein TadG-related protein n=1 Tax=Arthrobacter sp. Ld5 TaxID=649152 RepID=UPI003EB8A689